MCFSHTDGSSRKLMTERSPLRNQNGLQQNREMRWELGGGNTSRGGWEWQDGGGGWSPQRDGGEFSDIFHQEGHGKTTDEAGRVNTNTQYGPNINKVGALVKNRTGTRLTPRSVWYSHIWVWFNLSAYKHQICEWRSECLPYLAKIIDVSTYRMNHQQQNHCPIHQRQQCLAN